MIIKDQMSRNLIYQLLRIKTLCYKHKNTEWRSEFILPNEKNEFTEWITDFTEWKTDFTEWKTDFTEWIFFSWT